MEYLPSAIADHAIFEELVKVAGETPLEGCFVEVGVYKGGTASYLTELAEKQEREIFLYDTFEGMPYSDAIDPWKEGTFADDVDYEKIKAHLSYANVIKGIFPESAVVMPKIAFAHIDVDQYRGYIDCINYLSPMMMPGGVMWFDDYELEGAKKAIEELVEEGRLIWASSGHMRCYIKF